MSSLIAGISLPVHVTIADWKEKKKLFPNLSWMLPFIFVLLLAKDNYQHKLIFF